LARLVQRGHFDAVEEIVLEYRYNRMPLWVTFVANHFGEPYGLVGFQSEVVRKVPDWLYERFKNTPPYTAMWYQDTTREAVGIFEPYEVERTLRLVN
jgi:hypothetical protein